MASTQMFFPKIWQKRGIIVKRSLAFQPAVLTLAKLSGSHTSKTMFKKNLQFAMTTIAQKHIVSGVRLLVYILHTLLYYPNDLSVFQFISFTLNFKQYKQSSCGNLMIRLSNQPHHSPPPFMLLLSLRKTCIISLL